MINLMGLIAILVTSVIIILLLVFSKSLSSPFNTSSNSIKGKDVKSNTQEVIDTNDKNTRLEYEQTKKLDIP